MDRGLRAQLSPKEQATLRQISIAESQQDDLRPEDLQQLVLLKLIEREDGLWRLTEVGAQRVSTL